MMSRRWTRGEENGKDSNSGKGKLGAKVRVGGSPEPMQDGWAGVNLNITTYHAEKGAGNYDSM